MNLTSELCERASLLVNSAPVPSTSDERASSAQQCTPLIRLPGLADQFASRRPYPFPSWTTPSVCAHATHTGNRTRILAHHPQYFWSARGASTVVENPHGLHWNTFRFSANARQILWSRTIGSPQTGQGVSMGPSSIIPTISSAVSGCSIDPGQSTERHALRLQTPSQTS